MSHMLYLWPISYIVWTSLQSWRAAKASVDCVCSCHGLAVNPNVANPKEPVSKQKWIPVPILQWGEMKSPFFPFFSLILFFLPRLFMWHCSNGTACAAFSIWLSALRLCMTLSTQRPGGWEGNKAKRRIKLLTKKVRKFLIQCWKNGLQA